MVCFPKFGHKLTLITVLRGSSKPCLHETIVLPAGRNKINGERYTSLHRFSCSEDVYTCVNGYKCL